MTSSLEQRRFRRAPFRCAAPLSNLDDNCASVYTCHQQAPHAGFLNAGHYVTQPAPFLYPQGSLHRPHGYIGSPSKPEELARSALEVVHKIFSPTKCQFHHGFSARSKGHSRLFVDHVQYRQPDNLSLCSSSQVRRGAAPVKPAMAVGRSSTPSVKLSQRNMIQGSSDAVFNRQFPAPPFMKKSSLNSHPLHRMTLRTADVNEKQRLTWPNASSEHSSSQQVLHRKVRCEQMDWIQNMRCCNSSMVNGGNMNAGNGLGFGSAVDSFCSKLGVETLRSGNSSVQNGDHQGSQDGHVMKGCNANHSPKIGCALPIQEGISCTQFPTSSKRNPISVPQHVSRMETVEAKQDPALQHVAVAHCRVDMRLDWDGLSTAHHMSEVGFSSHATPALVQRQSSQNVLADEKPGGHMDPSLPLLTLQQADTPQESPESFLDSRVLDENHGETGQHWGNRPVGQEWSSAASPCIMSQCMNTKHGISTKAAHHDEEINEMLCCEETSSFTGSIISSCEDLCISRDFDATFELTSEDNLNRTSADFTTVSALSHTAACSRAVMAEAQSSTRRVQISDLPAIEVQPRLEVVSKSHVPPNHQETCMESFSYSNTGCDTALSHESATDDQDTNDKLVGGKRILGKRYVVDKIVGEGAYGTVLKCHLLHDSDQTVAVKLFKITDSDSDAADVTRIMNREAKIMKMLRGQHSNITTLLDVFPVQDKLCICMEFVPQTLLQLLEANGGSGLDGALVQKLIYQTLSAIEFLHSQDVVFRDVKPENILITSPNLDAKLCDFGFARVLPPDTTSAGSTLTEYVATRWYRAPELLLGGAYEKDSSTVRSSYGKAVDLWSVGCLMAELLTGQPLFPGESDIDQLYKILSIVGPMTDEQMLYFQSNPCNANISFRIKSPTTLRYHLKGHIPEDALSVVTALLQMDPRQRPNAHEILLNPYFQNWRDADTVAGCNWGSVK